MKEENEKKVWTIGHSTRSIEQLVAMLRSFAIEIVADIRSFPGSKRYPHFNKEAIEIWLPDHGVEYIHLKKLGGRRPVHPGSINTAWKHPAFRGYADYMQTEEFKEGISELEEIALKRRTAYMCSEAVWWRCHRSLVSDYMKLGGWTVYHIMQTGKEEEHHYTSPAKIINGKLSYENDSLLF